MNLRSRLSTLIAIRVVLVTVLLGSAILVEVRRPGSFPVDPFFFLIGLTYALSVVYAVTARLAERHRWLLDLQFGADALLVSAFISVTGGITSSFSFLYLLPIVAAAMIRYRRVAAEVAVLSAGLYLGLVSAQYMGVSLPLVGEISTEAALPTLAVAQYTVATNLCAFGAVALLAGSLADSLRSAGAKLADASSTIRDLRTFNEHVINNLLSGLITTDAGGRVLTFNRAASSITGVAAQAAIGRDAVALLQLPDSTRDGLARLASSGTLKEDVHFVATDGRSMEVGVTASPLVLLEGGRGYLITFQDVTDVRRLERDARLQQRLAAVGEMAAGIAHEIRNPLASMSGSMQVLREELPLSEEQALLMDIVMRESERLNDTIRSFLAYARPQRLTTVRLDVGRLLEDMALLLRNSPELSDHHVVDVEVPERQVWCEADENQIRQVVWNLATNGLRAMAGGGRLLLAVSAEAVGGMVRLTVADQGCGIPADELDAIFQPFRSTFERGTGLGLATVHRIVTDYKGTVEVSSQVGVGTTVTVRLPGAGSLSAGRPLAEAVSALGVAV